MEYQLDLAIKYTWETGLETVNKDYTRHRTWVSLSYHWRNNHTQTQIISKADFRSSRCVYSTTQIEQPRDYTKDLNTNLGSNVDLVDEPNFFLELLASIRGEMGPHHLEKLGRLQLRPFSDRSIRRHGCTTNERRNEPNKPNSLEFFVQNSRFSKPQR